MTNNLKCPFCGTEIKIRKLLDGTVNYVCINSNCSFSYIPLPLRFWQALIDGKAAQEALRQIAEIKDCVEGCCAEIQHSLLPSITGNAKLRNAIDNETGAIDEYMSNIERIIASINKTGE